MATKRSDDMARSTEDSTTEKKWRKEYLDQTGIEADEPTVKPEHSQRGGHCGQGEAHAGEGQHGQEVVHGLVQSWGSSPHSQEDQAVSQ